MTDLERYKTFAQYVLNKPDELPDFDDIQERALKLGLLSLVAVTEPCGADCKCMEYYGELWFKGPGQCMRKTELLTK